MIINWYIWSLRWLTVSGNTYGRPIHGQYEVVGSSYPDGASYWKTMEGVYVKPNENRKDNSLHDEL